MSDAAVHPGQEYRISIRSRAEQAAAFDSARAHSRLVRRIKRLIVAGAAVFLAGAIVLTIFDPFSSLPRDVSISRATFNGTRITMENPRLSGFRKDGRPYQLVARSGVQDIRTPKIIELNEIDATIKISASDTIRVSAPSGRFDSGGDQMQLKSGKGGEKIRFRGSTYSMVLQSADINFKSGEVVSSEPVSLVMNNGTIDADSLQVADNGKRIVFIGNVRSVIKPPPETKAGQAAAGGARGTAARDGLISGAGGTDSLTPAEGQ